MSWDSGFIGMTTLFVPPKENHLVNIIALSGLGGHAYGSFKEREGDHMWLRDALPYDLVLDSTGDPIASITIFGFESTVVNSVSTQSLSDLAVSLRDSLLPLVRSSPVNPLIFIAHSLGGLVVKELLSMLEGSVREEDKQLAHAVYGVVFFGVPHDGMDITPLLPMVGSGPNKTLVKSMCQENSRVLRTLRRKFHLALGGQKHKEVICFYETELSPTPVMTKNGTWEMQGTPKILVTKESATNCLPPEDGSEHVCAIARSHSDMVKFRKNDPENRQTAAINARPIAPTRVVRDLESGDYGKQLFRTTDANETFDIHGAKVGLCGWQVFWSGDGDGLCEVLRECNTIPGELAEEVINQQPLRASSKFVWTALQSAWEVWR
ncbi:hypothetical protein NQ176_g3228 [Zarea fungicola]|uniref:Uncharacterized protein n=1 Tax=Zarea fungicola TaxID=93591 RepID=A0ACC1NKZ6_9HYPO|nr:hypothetical protein NQ176_g3228 [Lecanicillium fungicola]